MSAYTTRVRDSATASWERQRSAEPRDVTVVMRLRGEFVESPEPDAGVCASHDGASRSTPVNIPDPALRRAVLDALGKSSGETATRTDMASIRTLRAEWRGIADMEGLQYATGLRDLRLDNNRITSTIDFCGLTELEQLWLRNNRIGGTVDLSALTSLRTIQLANSRITAVELPSSLHTLYTLDASDNRIASIHLPWARDVFYLDLTGNRLTSIDLRRLGASGRDGRLTLRVGLGDNLLTSVNLGGSAGRITSLDLARNRFTSLSLPNMGSVTYLNAGNNHDLTSFTIGNGSDDLKTLLLHACDLSTLNVTGLDDLRYVNVEFNGMVTATGAHADATVRQRLTSFAGQRQRFWLTSSPAVTGHLH